MGIKRYAQLLTLLLASYILTTMGQNRQRAHSTGPRKRKLVQAAKATKAGSSDSRSWQQWAELASKHRLDTPVNIPVVVLVLTLGVFFVFFDKIAALVSTIVALASTHMFCRLVLGGYTRRIPLQIDHSTSAIKHNLNKNPADIRSIVVTGGCGFLGWNVTRELAKWASEDIQITVLDISAPHPSRAVSGVKYLERNLAYEDISDIINECDAVIHTAGLVDLTSDEACAYNAHVAATARLLDAAKLSRKCRFMVFTSSVGAVTSPFVVDRCQLDIPSDFIPPEMENGLNPSKFPFFCSYSSTKFFAERMCLAASSPSNGFRTVAIRMPMIFGLEDPMVVAPLLKSQRGYVPDGTGSLVEFVYVKNAASAHLHALKALMKEEEKTLSKPQLAGEELVSGRAFNVTNGDVPADAIKTWNNLISKANSRLELGLPWMKPIPYVIIYIFASLVEATFNLCCGHVPFRRNPVWNLTRAALRHSCTSITQSVEVTRNELGFTPRFTTLEAFDDMVSEKMERRKADIKPSEQFMKSISWSVDSGQVGIFERMSGPGMTNLEMAITMVSMLGGMMYAWMMRNPSWGNYEIGASLFFALINASAVVQCTTPTSKRWYHQGGRLSDRLAFVISAEVLMLVLWLHGTFTHPIQGQNQSFLAGALSQHSLVEAFGLVGAVLLTHYSPLRVQRAVGVLCACTGIAMLQARSTGQLEGMEWASQLLFLKYCVSHVPRHEPYV